MNQSNRHLPLALLAASIVMPLAGCATLPSGPNAAGAAPATDLRLGQSGRTDGPIVTPLRVVEDSRCPSIARCVWAGRIVVATRVGNRTVNLEQGKPVAVADGMLTLVTALPERQTMATPAPRDYRFSYSFSGGLR